MSEDGSGLRDRGALVLIGSKLADGWKALIVPVELPRDRQQDVRDVGDVVQKFTGDPRVPG